MSRVPGVNNADTVSSITCEEKLSLPGGGGGKFSYSHICKHVIKGTIRKMDTCFLVPVKMHKEIEEIYREDFLSVLGEWMDAFCVKKVDIDHFWIYMAYDGGYDSMKKCMFKVPQNVNIPHTVSDDALTHMNDVTKLEKAKYIVQLCREKGDVECWILRAYEITLSKMYKAAKLATEMQAIIAYLKACDIRVDIPFTTGRGRSDEQIFQAAANLFLLVIRLGMGISPEEAVGWYKSGNVAFFRYRDTMLEEFTRLSSLYNCQSYERYLKMREMAENNKNEYAAKEVGDILRLGMELRDSRGNRVFVKPDGEAACEFYRICIDKNYIPAYVPAVKTGALINERQQEELLQAALKENIPEALAYHAERLLVRADQLLQEEQGSAFSVLREAAGAISSLEDTYGEKHVLKASLLQTETYRVYNGGGNKVQDFDEELRRLFIKEMSNMQEEDVLGEVESAYLLAGQAGFYEAEYQLGKLFQERDSDKSQEYFRRGADKGCKWCRLEYGRMCRQQDPEKWLLCMRELGRQTQEDSALRTALAGCWIEAEDVLILMKEGKIELEDREIVGIYMQIDNIVREIYNQKEKNSSKIDRAIELCGKLMQFRNEVMKLLKKESVGQAT